MVGISAQPPNLWGREGLEVGLTSSGQGGHQSCPHNGTSIKTPKQKKNKTPEQPDSARVLVSSSGKMVHPNCMGQRLLGSQPFRSSPYALPRPLSLCIFYNVLYNKPETVNNVFPDSTSHSSKLAGGCGNSSFAATSERSIDNWGPASGD